LPPLRPENIDAMTIYKATHDQLIVGVSGPVAINQTAIHNAMELYEIQDRIDCFEKVVSASRTLLEDLKDNDGE